MFPDSFTIRTWCGGIVLLAGSSCGASQTSSTKVELPAEVGAIPHDLEDDFEVFAVNCSKCHGLERPFTAPVNDHKHWERYVAKMMRTPSSGISPQEAPAILAFLFWYTDRKTGRIAADNGNGVEPAKAPIFEAPATEPAVAPQGENTP